MTGGFRVLLILLCGVVGFAGWRASRSAQLVLEGAAPGAPSVQRQTLEASIASEEELVRRVATETSRLASLDKDDLSVDPFRPRPTPRPATPRPRPRAEPEPEPIVPPSVLLAAFDTSQPEVVIRFDGATSHRLRAGDVWNGWTVRNISPNGIEIEGYGQIMRLAVPGRES